MKKTKRRQFLKFASKSAGVVAGIGASRFIRTLTSAFVLSVIIVQTAMANNVIVSENNKVVSLQNEYVKVNFDLRDGCYQVVNVKENLICIDKAYAHVNDRKTTERPFAEGFSLTVAMVEPVFHIDYFVITQLFK